MRCTGSVAYRLVTLMGLLFPVAAVGSAQEQPADLMVRLDARGRAGIHLSLLEKPPDEAATVRALSAAMGSPLHDVSIRTDDAWEVTARAQVLKRRGLVFEGRLNLAALAAAPKATGIGTIEAVLSAPEAGFTRCSLAGRTRNRSSAASYSGLVRRTDPPVDVGYGYTPRQLFGLAWPLVAALLAPFVATHWMRRATLRAKAADPAKLWFGYWRFLQTLGTATWVVWIAICLTLPLERLLRFVVPSSEGGAFILGFTLLFIPPFVVALLCQAMSNDVFTQVRGTVWTAQDMRRQILWNLMARIVPLVFLIIGVAGVADENTREAAVGLVLAFFTWTTGHRALARSQDMTLHALSVGPLRDRVFALAEQAKVELRELYVLPAGKSRLVNAFAASGRAVILSEELVAGLSRAEVDAIVAHELSHMRKGHVGALQRTFRVVLLLAVGGAIGALSAIVPDLERFRGLLPLGLAVVIGAVTFASRRRERAADAGSAAITGDPEAMISALARLSRMNQLPVQWSKWQERFISHPSTVRRAEALAARFGIPRVRVKALLDPPDEPGEAYPIPTRSEMDERIFSTSYKQGASVRNMWALLAVSVLVPSLAGLMVQHFGLRGNAMWATYAGGFVLAALAWLVAYDWLSTLGYLGLRDKLAARLAAEGIRPGELGGVFVSFAPHGSARLYEGFHEWDIGFVILTPDRFCYIGEQARFALTLEQVTSVQLHPGPHGWLRCPRVAVSWRDGEREGVFLVNTSLGRRRQMARETRLMLDRVAAWRDGRAPTEADPLPALPSPDFGEVTSRDPASVGLTSNVMWMAVFGVAGAGLFGLSFQPPACAGWYVVAVMAFMGLGTAFPSRRRGKRSQRMRKGLIAQGTPADRPGPETPAEL